VSGVSRSFASCAVCGEAITSAAEFEVQCFERVPGFPTAPSFVHTSCRDPQAHSMRLMTAVSLMQVASALGWIEHWSDEWREFAMRLRQPARGN
jgi:hypothetical protein